MKTILIPTDFSENAYNALRYAVQLFAAEECQFLLVHSFENQVSNLTSRVDIGKTEALVEELYANSDAQCEAVKDKIEGEFKNEQHQFQPISTSLRLSRAINKLIVKEQVDFVFMGSKGSTGASDVLLGSNTLKMIQRIKKAPLIVIPPKMEFRPVERIAFATGFKRSFEKDGLRPLLYISTLNNAQLEVIHVQQKEKMNDDQLTNFHRLFEILKDARPESNWLHKESDMYDAISSYLNKEAVDLLVMIYYKHHAIMRLFREATVKDLAKYTLIPFMILPEAN